MRAMQAPPRRPSGPDATASRSTEMLDRILPVMSVFTMLMTVPQIWTVWVTGNASGVSLLSWGAYLLSACLWFVYGLRKGDKTIYVACIGWVILDAAVVAGVLVRG